MPKFRKHSTTVEAIQYTGDNKREIIEFANNNAMTNTCYSHITIFATKENFGVDVGDWVIKDVTGEFHPCKPDIFETNYVPIESPSVKHMKPLTLEDIHTANAFIKKDKKYYLLLWHLMAAKHKVGGDMPAVMFFI